MTSTSSGLSMLTSGMSQYLHPDYIQPLPTTLDAKKSPLALLAQTCSAIGKDASPSKPIIPPFEKEDRSEKNSDSESSSKRPNSRGSKESSRDSKPGFRTFPPKEIPPLVPISNHSSEKAVISSSHMESKVSPTCDPSLGSANPTSSSSSSSRPVSRGGVSSSGRRSASRSSTGKPESSSSSSDHHHHQPSNHRSRESPLSSSASSSGGSHPNSSSPSYSSPSSYSSCYSSPSYSLAYSKPSSSHPTSVMQSPSSLSSTLKPQMTHPSLLSGYPSPAHLAGYPHPLSYMGHSLDPNSGYHSALAAHSSLSSLSAAAAAAQSSALKAAAAGAGSPAALSPYVTYARVRTPSGATTLVPVCRDPLCTNCQLTLQNSHLSATCTAPGCSQCAHEKSLTSLSALGHLSAGAAASSLFLPPLSSASSLSNNLSALSSLHSLYHPSALAAAHQGLPYICNWVAGNDYCGKRFTSSEELLQHLRSHTASMDASTLAAQYSASLGGLPSALAAYPQLISAPLSPNSLRHAYPTSVSPVSSMLGANRYHPYKSHLTSVPATPPNPHSMGPLGPYLSPYTLFGQRLGAAVVP